MLRIDFSVADYRVEMVQVDEMMGIKTPSALVLPVGCFPTR